MRAFAKLAAMAVAFGVCSVNAEDVTVTNIDFSGKPPFKRVKQVLPAADVARFETQSQVEVRQVNYRGKPPFRRNVEINRVVDLAQFETFDEEKFIPTPRKGKR